MLGIFIMLMILFTLIVISFEVYNKYMWGKIESFDLLDRLIEKYKDDEDISIRYRNNSILFYHNKCHICSIKYIYSRSDIQYCENRIQKYKDNYDICKRYRAKYDK